MELYQSDQLSIDLRDLITHLLNKLWIILLVGFFSAILGYGYSKYIATPLYTTSTKLYVMEKIQSFSELSLSDLQIGSQLASDYILLIESRPVMEKVIENLELDLDYKQLKEYMSITNPANTPILVISVNYPDAYMAKEIVDEITAVACARISEIMHLEQPNVFEYGYEPDEPSSPNILKNTIIAALIGCILTAAIILVLYILDDTIQSEEDIERYLGLATLGRIPFVEEEKGRLGKGKSRSSKKKKIG